MHSPPTSGGASAGEATFSVSELAARIHRVLEGAFPYPVWVAGEVANLHRSNAGHIYLDLMERAPEDSGDEQALLHAVIWESRRHEINRALMRAKWGRVSDGDEIKVKVGVDFYRPQGRITLQIHTVDPDYTLSRWKKERERVVAVLRTEGVFDHNRRLLLSEAPCRVGLITSAGSSAHADFLATLAESGMGWRVDFHHSGVQGDAARASLTEALRRLSAADPDVICIVRGGGSTTDLAVFDHVEVARAIAPLPGARDDGHRPRVGPDRLRSGGLSLREDPHRLRLLAGDPEPPLSAASRPGWEKPGGDCRVGGDASPTAPGPLSHRVGRGGGWDRGPVRPTPSPLRRTAAGPGAAHPEAGRRETLLSSLRPCPRDRAESRKGAPPGSTRP